MVFCVCPRCRNRTSAGGSATSQRDLHRTAGHRFALVFEPHEAYAQNCFSGSDSCILLSGFRFAPDLWSGQEKVAEGCSQPFRDDLLPLVNSVDPDASAGKLPVHLVRWDRDSDKARVALPQGTWAKAPSRSRWRLAFTRQSASTARNRTRAVPLVFRAANWLAEFAGFSSS